jgi:mannose-6-phosphate isomerase-like protein (cupin superfamily)
MNQYGIKVDTLEQFVSCPKGRVLISLPEYQLERREFTEGASVSFVPPRGFESVVYVEEGRVRVGKETIGERESIALAPGSKATGEALVPSAVYIFSGPADKKTRYGKKQKANDFRDKYWGTIETICSTPHFAAKRMLVRRGCAASLEYHCRKLETYYIHSGKLLLRLRAGRGEDRFFELEKGQTALTPPGLMHQRGGLEDTVIIEISTKDEDADSFLVEDGAKHPMPRLAARLAPPGAGKKRICFDIDGVLCSQVRDGESYTKALPRLDMIALVNCLYDAGHTIFIHTARFMGSSGNDQRAAYETGYDFCKKQLAEWGVRYHALFLGKPSSDIFIDDRALFYHSDVRAVEQEIQKHI